MADQREASVDEEEKNTNTAEEENTTQTTEEKTNTQATEDDSDTTDKETEDDTNTEETHKSFRDLGVTEVLCEACDLLGWKKPTKIQIEAIPVALEGMQLLTHTLSNTHT
ncbi:ATP-dependent rRNA helicase rrp3-like [Sinocyclocheilus grahami]|uniref:ATP-dependent rRNA helicase rrp3-like n=1 Tax=Sinocyclocheilus grahami TaxID=75366 RepID=UPI0007ACEAC3|nr:PREDICTED: ATP-dependent rRNA helicase rrp3-like [Sinocyclocheilus grahami]